MSTLNPQPPSLSTQRFLVTGALGCIGAWVVRNLVREGTTVAVLDLASNPHRLRLILNDEELARVQFIAGDITDLPTVEAAFKDSAATHVIHLAGLQVPFCKADPPLGARVNVVGTVNVFEAAKRAGLKRVVYASSIAVYGLSDEYPEGPLPHDAPLKPRSHYGVYKQANEGTARVYWLDDGLSSVGLRAYTVYGPGRDQGLTSSPTKAMLAAAAGRPYHIGFGGRCAYQFADDVARAFIACARAPFQGAEIFNLRGSVATMGEIVAAIEAAAPDVKGQITFDDKPLPFPEDMDDAAFATALGRIPDTPLAEGVRQTIDIFRRALAEGRISAGN
ncbi:MAG: NAD-dependent epimerase/dehydratase family protein [Anaerolineae bacterium]|nr:NAD-dependent epimerase/dehydratase family protein [Thermoflexales bacterium]MDW8408378.1 NAD-dependent epimerase/dehydratase family protein [Anaerolineae bacterium]